MRKGNTVLEALKLALIDYLVIQHDFEPVVHNWKRSDFVNAAKFFSEKLSVQSVIIGNKKQLIDTYISNSTLERIFKYGYALPNPIDKRRLNTLNKLALCLGYKNFSDYSFASNHHLNIDFKQLILNANAAEFEAYKNLPKANIAKLLPYYVKDGPAYNKIYKLVHKQISRDVSLKDDKNPSYHEVLEVEVLKKEPEVVRIKTEECWYLKWHSKDENINVNYYNNNNTQLYLLNKTDAGWKINVNHYPYHFPS